ncbi:hypothetical protein MNV49_007846 [Pseudohyphozyma bogoriensis]|nr:hypothetical protein MNV49_007846 [Pseudohyphozyma bogoriensis]
MDGAKSLKSKSKRHFRAVKRDDPKSAFSIAEKLRFQRLASQLKKSALKPKALTDAEEYRRKEEGYETDEEAEAELKEGDETEEGKMEVEGEEKKEEEGEKKKVSTSGPRLSRRESYRADKGFQIRLAPKTHFRGIKGLTGLINDTAPNAIKHVDIKSLFGRKVAIDASMSLYQFLIAVRMQDGQQLQNDSGETTSHLMGMFYRTLRMVDNDLKPCYVFDGKPPALKTGVLNKRFAGREEAKEDEAEAKEVGTVEDVDKLSRRQVKVTRQQNEDVRKLLTLMGIPWIVVYGAGTEDMDTLTFSSPKVLRHLTFSEQRKMPIDVIDLEDVLKGLELTMDQFIDMCMLCGCDYLEPIKGVGAKTAYKLVQEYDSMEDILDHLRKGKNAPPEVWPYEEARELFKKPEVIPGKDVTLEWKEPDVEGLVEFLVKDNGFNEDRVRKGAEKLKAHLKGKQQGRLDGFFKVLPSEPKDGPGKKRKQGDDKSKDKGKKAKGKK